MPTVKERVKDLREELQSRLDITEEQLKGLAAYAGQKIGHQTGPWEGGRPVPGEGNEGMIIVAMFDNAPDGYDVDEQGDEYTFGECRAYVLATADIMGPMKDNLIAAGDNMFCVVYRLFASGQPIRKVMDEDTFTSALCDEFEALAEMAGLNAASDTWECPSCKKLNPDTLEREDAEEEEEAQQSSFCAGCGAARVEVVPAAGQH
jgi:hypothetical protein